MIGIDRKRAALLILFAAAGVLSMAAPAQAPRQAAASRDSQFFMEPTPQVAAEFRALVEERAHEVADRRGPRLAIVAAWSEAAIVGPDAHDDVDAWLQSAMESGRDDVMVWWMLLDTCATLRDWCGSYRDHARARLAELEPDNAAVWLRLIRSHDGDSDVVIRRHYLALAAQARRYEDHERDWARVLRDFYAEIRVPESHRNAYTLGVGSEIARYTHILGMASQVGGSAASSGGQCGEGGRPIESEAVVAECRAAFGLMALSTNPGTRRFALERALELAGDDEDRRFRAIQLQRLLWVDAHWGDLRLGIDDDAKIVAVFDDRIRNGEEASREHILARAGVAAAPPPDWDPPNVAGRVRDLLHEAGVGIAEGAAAQ